MKRIIKLSISLAYYILIVQPATLISRLLRKKTNRSPVVLYYHEIPAGCKQNFNKQMKLLSQKTIPVKLEHLSQTTSNAKPIVAITFDDAFRSVKEDALPALLDYSIPATIFIPTAYFGKEPGWIQNPESPILRETVMSKNELLELPGDIISFGSHTHTHPRLSTLNAKEIRHELAASRGELKKLFKKDITSIAFPHGDFNTLVLATARECGYAAAYSIMPEPFFRNNTQKYTTGRTAAYPWDWKLEFHLKTHGAYSWLPLAIKIKKILLKKQKD